jgi:hypothetical protein
MYHDLPHFASIWAFLLAVDKDLAEETRKQGCSSCGGRLHCADYPRKPRGARLQLTEFPCLRLSFCCDRDGCRKRATPPSVRFLGRKVYLGVIVILISAMRQGPSPRRVSELSKRFGADESTIARWQIFWREHFPQTHFWKVARARLITYGEIKSLPYSLVDAFLGRHPPCEGWTLLLRFLSPITVAGGLQIKVPQ